MPTVRDVCIIPVSESLKINYGPSGGPGRSYSRVAPVHVDLGVKLMHSIWVGTRTVRGQVRVARIESLITLVGKNATTFVIA